MADPTIDISTINSELGFTWQQSPALTCDAYTPKLKPNGKVIISIHPGGFTGGKPSFDKAIVMANTYVPQGYTVVCPQYTLVNDLSQYNQILTALLDINNFIAFVLKNADKYHIQSKIIVFGASAGAILALHAAYAKQEFLPPANPLNINSQWQNIEACISCWGSMPPTYVDSSTIPIALFHGNDDHTVPTNCLNIQGMQSCGGKGLEPYFDSEKLCLESLFWDTKKPTHGCNTQFFTDNIIPLISNFFHQLNQS